MSTPAEPCIAKRTGRVNVSTDGGDAGGHQGLNGSGRCAGGGPPGLFTTCLAGAAPGAPPSWPPPIPIAPPPGIAAIGPVPPPEPPPPPVIIPEPALGPAAGAAGVSVPPLQPASVTANAATPSAVTILMPFCLFLSNAITS